MWCYPFLIRILKDFVLLRKICMRGLILIVLNVLNIYLLLKINVTPDEKIWVNIISLRLWQVTIFDFFFLIRRELTYNAKYLFLNGSTANCSNRFVYKYNTFRSAVALGRRRCISNSLKTPHWKFKHHIRLFLREFLFKITLSPIYPLPLEIVFSLMVHRHKRKQNANGVHEKPAVNEQCTYPDAEQWRNMYIFVKRDENRVHLCFVADKWKRNVWRVC